MANILVGSVPGVIVGERLARSVPAGGLRPALGCAMLASALGVASKAGLDLPAAARSPRSRPRRSGRTEGSRHGNVTLARVAIQNRLARNIDITQISFSVK